MIIDRNKLFDRSIKMNRKMKMNDSMFGWFFGVVMVLSIACWLAIVAAWLAVGYLAYKGIQDPGKIGKGVGEIVREFEKGRKSQ